MNRDLFYIKTIFFFLFVSSAFGANQSFLDRISKAEKLSQTEPDSAIVILNDLLNEAVLINDKEYVFRSLNELGVICYYQGDYEGALDFYFDAKSHIDIETQSDLLATVQSNIGALYKAIGFYDKALLLYKEALAIDRGNNDSLKVAIRLNNIAGIYVVWGKYDLAIDFYQRALAIDKKMGNDEEVAIRYGNIGVIYYRLNDFELSADFLIRALEIDKSLKNDFNTAIRLNNLGRTYVKMNKLDSAVSFYKQAIIINQNTDNLPDLSVSYRNLGGVFLVQGNKDSAEYYFKKSLRIAQKTGSKSQQQEVIGSLADLYYDFGNYSQSLNYFEASLEIAKELKIINEQASLLKSLSDVYIKLNRFRDANLLLVEYANLKDSIYSLISQEKIAKYRIQYSIEKKEREIGLLQKEKQVRSAKIIVQRWTIWGILVLSILIIFIVLILQRNKALKNREEKLALENHLNRYMQKAYRQQMNPHFIFNTLNSIQSFILKNDKEGSSTYLSKFAQLMRMVLENSDNELITLRSELEAIKLYLELEKLRFEKNININLQIEESLLECKLPPLIFQPFIENAIWHGFMHKKEDGELSIIVYVVDDKLVCEIIDNGIGRKAAEKYKKKEHKSFGRSITKKRLELINTINNLEHRFVTEDLVENNKNTLGTKVTIYLPLIDV